MTDDAETARLRELGREFRLWWFQDFPERSINEEVWDNRPTFAAVDTRLGRWLDAREKAAEERGRTVDCPECKDSMSPGSICNLGADDPAAPNAWVPCPTCNGAKRIRREDAGWLEAADKVDEFSFAHAPSAIANMLRDCVRRRRIAEAQEAPTERR